MPLGLLLMHTRTVASRPVTTQSFGHVTRPSGTAALIAQSDSIRLAPAASTVVGRNGDPRNDTRPTWDLRLHSPRANTSRATLRAPDQEVDMSRSETIANLA